MDRGGVPTSKYLYVSLLALFTCRSRELPSLMGTVYPSRLLAQPNSISSHMHWRRSVASCETVFSSAGTKVIGSADCLPDFRISSSILSARVGSLLWVVDVVTETQSVARLHGLSDEANPSQAVSQGRERLDLTCWPSLRHRHRHHWPWWQGQGRILLPDAPLRLILAWFAHIPPRARSCQVSRHLTDWNVTFQNCQASWHVSCACGSGVLTRRERLNSVLFLLSAQAPAIFRSADVDQEQGLQYLI